MENSNFYCPSFGKAIVFRMHEKDESPALAATEEWDPDSLTALVSTRLSDCPKMNTNYADLLRNFGVSDMSNGQITEELGSVLGIRTSGESDEFTQWTPAQSDMSRARGCIHNWCSWDSSNSGRSTLERQNYRCESMK